MLAPIAIIAHHPHLLARFPKYCGVVLTPIDLLIHKVKQLAYPSFVATSGIYYCGWGAQELTASLTSSAKETSVKTDRLALSRSHLVTHGGLIGATGVCGVLEALNSFNIINYGYIATAVCTAGSTFFLLANLAGLEENIRVYEELRVIEKEGGVKDRQKHALQESSAIWGILSNLGYIVATASVLFGASTAMALVFGVIGAFSGGFKILYEFVSHRT